MITEGKAREYLAKYMFYGESVFKKVGTLSGGERSRLKLAVIMFNDINFLILDEPTNHLDIDSREELESFLKEFQGTILFVSHDRYFINNKQRSGRIRKGPIVSMRGIMSIIRKSSVEFKSASQNQKEENKVKKEKKSKLIKTKENKWKKVDLEKRIEDLEEVLKYKEEEINKFCDNYEKLNIAYNEKLEIEKELDILMEKYLNL